MKNFHKISTIVLLILIGAVAGYYLFNSDFLNKPPITGNTIILENLSEKTPLIEINKTEEISKEYNNPPINKEDYINLLGEIDYNKSYELFFSIDENDSAINYSENPIEEVIDFLDNFIFWEDKDLYKIEDYWASPNESLNLKKGDDEDYALLALALFDNFQDKNQNCYLIGNEEFTGLFCFSPNYQKYYGKNIIKSYTLYGIYSDNWWQGAGDVWISKITLNVDEGYTENLVRADLRNFIKDFMIDSVGYCCTDYWKNDMGINYENRDKLKFLYNKKEFYELKNTKDLENWIYDKMKDQIFGQSFIR